MVTFESTAPRNLPTASFKSILTVDSSPMRRIWSSFLMPARNAGVFGKTLIHRQHAFAHLNDEAQAAELAFGGELHLSVHLRPQQNRMRVERATHAVDGGVFNFARVFDRPHVLRHKIEDVFQVNDIFHSESTWLMSNSLALPLAVTRNLPVSALPSTSTSGTVFSTASSAAIIISLGRTRFGST